MVNSNDICALAKNPIVCSSGIGIDADTEKKINMCYLCQCSKAPLHLWYWLAEPWYQKHVDCVDYNGQNLLVITDIHSKWVDAYTMKAPLLQIDVVLVPGDREINLPLEDPQTSHIHKPDNSSHHEQDAASLTETSSPMLLFQSC